MVKTTKPLIPPEKREFLVSQLVDYFASEHDINLGNIAADEILGFILEKVGNEMYNQALADVEPIIRQGSESILVNINTLAKT